MGKYRVVLLGSGDVTIRLSNYIKTQSGIELVGVIPDNSAGTAVLELWHKKMQEIPLLEFSDLEELKVDGIVAVEYRQLVPLQYVKRYPFFNCHAGILPKYRGFGANAWAIMNGEEEIGYTIHAMNEKFDDGPIYFTKKIKIAPLQTYAEVHGEMVKSIIRELPRVLRDILDGKITGIPQEGERVYCHRFYKEMGQLTDFDVTSAYLFNLYRCMAKPLGTGMYFAFEGERYNIGKLILGREKNICDYIGIPGRIVNIEEAELWVKTKDNVIVLSGLTDSEERLVDVNKKFRIGRSLSGR